MQRPDALFEPHCNSGMTDTCAARVQEVCNGNLVELVNELANEASVDPTVFTHQQLRSLAIVTGVRNVMTLSTTDLCAALQNVTRKPLTRQGLETSAYRYCSALREMDVPHLRTLAKMLSHMLDEEWDVTNMTGADLCKLLITPATEDIDSPGVEIFVGRPKGRLDYTSLPEDDLSDESDENQMIFAQNQIFSGGFQTVEDINTAPNRLIYIFHRFYYTNRIRASALTLLLRHLQADGLNDAIYRGLLMQLDRWESQVSRQNFKLAAHNFVWTLPPLDVASLSPDEKDVYDRVEQDDQTFMLRYLTMRRWRLNLPNNLPNWINRVYATLHKNPAYPLSDNKYSLALGMLSRINASLYSALDMLGKYDGKIDLAQYPIGPTAALMASRYLSATILDIAGPDGNGQPDDTLIRILYPEGVTFNNVGTALHHLRASHRIAQKFQYPPERTRRIAPVSQAPLAQVPSAPGFFRSTWNQLFS